MQSFKDKINQELKKYNDKTHFYIITDKNYDEFRRFDKPSEVMKNLKITRYDFDKMVSDNIYKGNLYNDIYIFKFPTRILTQPFREVRGVLVSENGVVAEKSGKILPYITIDNYRYVKINRKNVAVHKLMSEAWFGGVRVHHKDDTRNNKKENLFI